MFEVSRQVRRRVELADALSLQTPGVFERIDAGVDELPDPWMLFAEQRAGGLRAAQQVVNRLLGWMHLVAAVADEQKDSRVLGVGSTGMLCAVVTGVNPAAGSAMVARAVALRAMPATSASFAAGRIGAGHVQVLTGAAGQIADFADVEAGLVATAEIVEPAELARLVRVLVEQSRPEAADEDLEVRRQRRALSLSPLPDGIWRIDGYLDPVSGQHVAEALSGFMDRAVPGDTRSPRQRRADALVDMVAAAAANTRPLGVSGVSITVDIGSLPGPVRARMEDGSPMGPDTAALMTCTPQLAVIFGRQTERGFVPLHLARTARRASHHQWAALVARDGGCLRCGRASRFCHAHHIVGWADGGRTDIGNLALLCARCHTALHAGRYAIDVEDGIPTIRRL